MNDVMIWSKEMVISGNRYPEVKKGLGKLKKLKNNNTKNIYIFTFLYLNYLSIAKIENSKLIYRLTFYTIQ
jgi:hypothetical protein